MNITMGSVLPVSSDFYGGSQYENVLPTVSVSTTQKPVVKTDHTWLWLAGGAVALFALSKKMK